METKAELGMDADPMAAKVETITMMTTFPAVMLSPFACT